MIARNRLACGLCVATFLAFALGSAGHPLPGVDTRAITPQQVFPDRDDLTLLQWDAEDSIRWKAVVRDESGRVIHLSQAQPEVDRWTAEVRDATNQWWARYTFDLGLDAEVAAELAADWADHDWFDTMLRLKQEGRLAVTHSIETSDGLSLVEADDGTGDPVRELGRRFQERSASLESQGSAETIRHLTALALDGYFRHTSQMPQLLVILSGGRVTTDTVLGLRTSPRSSPGASSTDEPVGSPSGEGGTPGSWPP